MRTTVFKPCKVTVHKKARSTLLHKPLRRARRSINPNEGFMYLSYRPHVVGRFSDVVPSKALELTLGLIAPGWRRLNDHHLEYSKIEQSVEVCTVMTCICYVPKPSKLNSDANASMQAMHTNNNTIPLTMSIILLLFPSNYEGGPPTPSQG